MWFLVCKDDVETLLPTARNRIELSKTFVKNHPNYHTSVGDFVCVELDNETVMELGDKDKLRVASYRWKKESNDGKNNKIPANYEWFMQYLKENHFVGWMDFAAGAVVGVDSSHVVSYMGSLYANLTCFGEWMIRSEDLMSALGRCWIFQETAFGLLDPQGIDQLINHAIMSGRQMIENGDLHSFENYI